MRASKVHLINKQRSLECALFCYKALGKWLEHSMHNFFRVNIPILPSKHEGELRESDKVMQTLDSVLGLHNF